MEGGIPSWPIHGTRKIRIRVLKCVYVCFEEPIVSAKMPTPLVYPKITQSKSLDNDSPLALKCALGKLPFWCVGGIRDGLRNAVDFSLWV